MDKEELNADYQKKMDIIEDQRTELTKKVMQYNYDIIINNIKNRNENGWYINAGLAELVAVTTVCCLPEIATGVTAVLESLPALLDGIVGVIVISKIPMGNDMHNVDSCEEGI